MMPRQRRRCQAVPRSSASARHLNAAYEDTVRSSRQQNPGIPEGRPVQDLYAMDERHFCACSFEIGREVRVTGEAGKCELASAVASADFLSEIDLSGEICS